MNSRELTFQNSPSNDPRDGCPECEFKGYIPTGPNSVRLCECRYQKKVEKIFECSRISHVYREKTFANYEIDGRPSIVKDMFESAKNYVQRFDEIKNQDNNWLVFLGEPGSGKTHLTLAVANELIRRDHLPVLYFQHVEGMSELISIVKRDEDGVREKLSEMKRADFLVWDDLFKPMGNQQQAKNFEIAVAFEVLNFRYLNRMPTAINSEHAPAELLAIDRGVGSRIIERGKGHMVAVNGLECNYRLL